jgi:GxxExxY protein
MGYLPRGIVRQLIKVHWNMSFQSSKYHFQEKKVIKYKDIILPRGYNANFVVYDKIILESKVIEILTNSHVKQTLNYLAASKLRLGLLVNFVEESLTYKRIIL